MLPPPELEELAQKAVLFYNRVRSPEVTAKLVFASPTTLTVSFSGGSATAAAYSTSLKASPTNSKC